MWRAEGPVHRSPVASIFVRPIGKGSPIQRALHAKGDFVQDGRDHRFTHVWTLRDGRAIRLQSFAHHDDAVRYARRGARA
jgi:hypothetical protein